MCGPCSSSSTELLRQARRAGPAGLRCASPFVTTRSSSTRVSTPRIPTAIERAAEQLSTLITEATRDPSARCDQSLFSTPPSSRSSTRATAPISATIVPPRSTHSSTRRCPARRTRRPSRSGTSRSRVSRAARTSAGARRSAQGGRHHTRRPGRDRHRTQRGNGRRRAVDARSGPRYVPLDPTYPTERLAFMAGDAGIAALLAESETARDLCPPGAAVIDPADAARAFGCATYAVARAERSRLRHLHVGLDRRAQGRDDRAPQRHQLLHGDGRAVDRPTGPARRLAGRHQHLVRHLGARAVLDAHARLHTSCPGRRGAAVHRRRPAPPAPPARRDRWPSASSTSPPTQDAAARPLPAPAREAPRSPTRTASPRCGRRSATSTSSAGCTRTRRVTGAAARGDHRARRDPRRAASCLPLHHPIRVAEEWAVVDNLSRRAGRRSRSPRAGSQRLRARLPRTSTTTRS